MTLPEIIKRLKDIRSGSHCKPPEWLENELSRLIANLESSSEVDRELSSLMRGETLVSADLKLSYRLTR